MVDHDQRGAVVECEGGRVVEMGCDGWGRMIWGGYMEIGGGGRYMRSGMVRVVVGGNGMYEYD